jgi:hypothetical protein
VGERVRRKESNTAWKVIKEKEEWVKGEGEEPGVPGIRLRFWEESASPRQGAGGTRSQRYSHRSRPFEDDWEILYDW